MTLLMAWANKRMRRGEKKSHGVKYSVKTQTKRVSIHLFFSAGGFVITPEGSTRKKGGGGFNRPFCVATKALRGSEKTWESAWEGQEN